MATASAETKPGTAPTIQYAYMFEKNKSPTVQLDSILRAIALYIVNQPPVPYGRPSHHRHDCHLANSLVCLDQGDWRQA